MKLVIEGSDEAVAEVLADLRANLQTLKRTGGLTNRDLGMFARVGEKTVWSWLKQNRVPDIENLVPIASALGLSFRDLFLPADEFEKLYGEGDAPLTVTVVSSRPSLRSSAGNAKDGRRRAAGSVKPVKKGRTRTTPAPKDSPFCKPEPRTVVVPASPEDPLVAA